MRADNLDSIKNIGFVAFDIAVDESGRVYVFEMQNEAVGLDVLLGHSTALVSSLSIYSKNDLLIRYFPNQRVGSVLRYRYTDECFYINSPITKKGFEDKMTVIYPSLLATSDDPSHMSMIDARLKSSFEFPMGGSVLKITEVELPRNFHLKASQREFMKKKAEGLNPNFLKVDRSCFKDKDGEKELFESLKKTFSVSIQKGVADFVIKSSGLSGSGNKFLVASSAETLLLELKSFFKEHERCSVLSIEECVGFKNESGLYTTYRVLACAGYNARKELAYFNTVLAFVHESPDFDTHGKNVTTYDPWGYVKRTDGCTDLSNQYKRCVLPRC